MTKYYIYFEYMDEKDRDIVYGDSKDKVMQDFKTKYPNRKIRSIEKSEKRFLGKRNL